MAKDKKKFVAPSADETSVDGGGAAVDAFHADPDGAIHADPDGAMHVDSDATEE